MRECVHYLKGHLSTYFTCTYKSGARPKAEWSIQRNFGFALQIFVKRSFEERFETSNVRCMSRKSDISQGPIDDLASKVIKYGN